MTGYSPFVPKHLLIAPQDLRTADPSFAEEYYHGRYTLAGTLVETNGDSPFTLPNTDSQWSRELQSFGWLRHLAASGDPLSGSHARAIVKEWIDLDLKSSKSIEWDIETAAQRLIAWLQHSILILSIPDHGFHQDFMRSLGTHARFLKRYAVNANEGTQKLKAYLALAYASICFSGHASSLKFARDRLDQELEAQIPADGCHVSRNPQAIVDILAYLLPYRQAFLKDDLEPSPAVAQTTERLLLALRFFRLGDGNLARFNGSGVTESDLVATLLRYDESYEPDSINTSSGGYERLETGDTVLLVDAGLPPKGELSTKAHAGSLSFEVSSGSDCVIVNAGAPINSRSGSPALWRSTAAHSTAVFYETSSCKFESTGQSGNLLEGQLFSASLKLESERKTDAEHETVTAFHHGYVREFGARHERAIRLHKASGSIEGTDWFSGPDKGDLYYTTKDTVTIHFHLHPDTDVAYDNNSDAIFLRTRSGKTWKFRSEKVKPRIEESIYFAGLSGPRKTNQITLRFHACKIPEIRWIFTPASL
ncbi:MAG: heparinase II/III family protein [Pseudomonadota bacterium]